MEQRPQDHRKPQAGYSVQRGFRQAFRQSLLVDEPYLSVLIPAYNEERTVEHVIDTVLKVPEDLEIIVVDDGSSDNTWELTRSRVDSKRVRAVRHTVNAGKGAAIRTGLTHARGHIVLIQDADLEYSPDDYGALLA
jgi:glycosyltransferase involved in cell wall biosynthesis